MYIFLCIFKSCILWYLIVTSHLHRDKQVGNSRFFFLSFLHLFISLHLFIYLFIHLISPSQSLSSRPPLSWPLPPPLHPLHLWEGWSPLWVLTDWHLKSMHSQIYPLPLRPSKAAWLGGQDPQADNRVRVSPHSDYWGIPWKLSCIRAEAGDIGPAHVCSLVGGSVSGSPQGSMSVDCWSSCGIPDSSGDFSTNSR